jgi:hypothetical protein
VYVPYAGDGAKSYACMYLGVADGAGLCWGQARCGAWSGIQHAMKPHPPHSPCATERCTMMHSSGLDQPSFHRKVANSLHVMEAVPLSPGKRISSGALMHRPSGHTEQVMRPSEIRVTSESVGVLVGDEVGSEQGPHPPHTLLDALLCNSLQSSSFAPIDMT